MTALKINTDGTMQPVEVIGKSIEKQNGCIYGYIGGHYDIIQLAPDAVMLVDGDGHIKGLPLNPAAMMISGFSVLVGAALILGQKYTPDGGIFTDCPERFVRFADRIQRM